MSFTQVDCPGRAAPLLVRKDKQYIVFVAGGRLIDRPMVGALPYEGPLLRRLDKLQSLAGKRPPLFGLPGSTQSLHSGRLEVRLNLSRFAVVRGEEIVVTVTVSPPGRKPGQLDLRSFARYFDVYIYGGHGSRGPEKILPANWMQDKRPAPERVTITREKPLELSFRLSDALTVYRLEHFTLGRHVVRVRFHASKPETKRSRVVRSPPGTTYPHELGPVYFVVRTPSKEDLDEMSRVGRAFMYAKTDKDLAALACQKVRVRLRLKSRVWKTYSSDTFAQLMRQKDLPRRRRDESPKQFGYSEWKKGIFFTTKKKGIFWPADVLRFRTVDGKWRVSELSLYD